MPSHAPADFAALTRSPGRHISIIAAMARNRVIGKGNRIPWRLPGEQQIFKKVTMGHHMVMGRKTYESLNRLLPGRTTVIVTRNPNYKVAGAIVVNTLQQAISACGSDEEVFIIGGAHLFELALPLADRIYLTTVQAEIAGDTIMPDFDLTGWKEISRQEFKADGKNPYDYHFSIYQRS
ncbi:MAG TPA: dihydrofolate reductase [Burkholderiales bacterium]|nr:dihydrofolate reductase [Burkholderiales bacterium]